MNRNASQQQPQQGIVSIFSMTAFLRVLLGTGLIYDAQHSNSVFQVQRAIQSGITATNIRCTDGAMPMLQSAPFLNSELLLPKYPSPEPSPTYKWFAVQLRWICAALCYLVVAESMLAERLSGWLKNTRGQDVADMYTIRQTCNQCIETMVTILSLVVYMGVDAYELYTQQQLSVPNDDYQWQLFLTEVLLVMLFGIIGMTNTIVQYRICVRLQNGIISTDDVSGSIL
jgi:hypothetical protein